MLMTDPRWDSVRSGGPIDGRWLQTVDLPGARPFSRGYDRVAVDGLLGECADTIDELVRQLRGARAEVAELRRQVWTRAGRRGRSRLRGRRARHADRRRPLRVG